MLAMDRLSITYGEALAFGAIQTCEREKLKPSARVIQTLRRGTLSFASEPIHVIVPDKSMVNNLKQLACHVRSYALPCGSFVRVEEGLLVCSPELCFANMATRIAFPQLVKLGFELCSLYTLQPGGSANYGRVLPPTTVRAIEAYLGKCPRTHGVATARKALRYISNASGSPMETALAIVLCLPPLLWRLRASTSVFELPHRCAATWTKCARKRLLSLRPLLAAGKYRHRIRQRSGAHWFKPDRRGRTAAQRLDRLGHYHDHSNARAGHGCRETRSHCTPTRKKAAYTRKKRPETGSSRAHAPASFTGYRKGPRIEQHETAQVPPARRKSLNVNGSKRMPVLTPS